MRVIPTESVENNPEKKWMNGSEIPNGEAEERIAEMDARVKKVDAAMRALNELTEEERVELFGNFCRDCGIKQPWHPWQPDNKKAGEVLQGCQCGNDE